MARKNTELTAEQQLANMRAKRAEQARRWRANNPEKQAQIQARYLQRKLAQMSTHGTAKGARE